MSSTTHNKFQLSPRKKAILDALLDKEGMASTEDKIPRRRESGPAPLSFSQQRLWFFDQFEPASFVYNVLTPVSLRGNLDVSALQEAFNHLVRRHEALRTTFELREGQPVQIIGQQQSIPIRRIDLSHQARPEQHEQFHAVFNDETCRPFDLKKGPLLRITLVRMAAEEHALLLAMHHIVTDGWSMNVLVREAVALYAMYSAGGARDLPPLPIQYADFAVWQRSWLQGEVLEQQLAYWKQHLGAKPAVLELPTDFPRPAVQTYRGANFIFPFSPALSQSLKTFCRAQQATMFMVLLAVFNVLFHRYTGQQEIIVGSPIANRNRKELEGLIGFFANTLPMRTNVSGELSFREVLARLKEAALGAYAHQDLPFEYLVEQFHPERSLSHSPLVQVMFNFEPTIPQMAEMPGLSASLMDYDNKSAKFDLTLFARDHGTEIFGTLEYNVDLFTSETIERMSGHLLTLLSSIVANHDQPISGLPLLTRHERYQMLEEWNATEAACPQLCAHQIFEAQVQHAPNRTALIFENQELTYAQLNARANQLAHYLSSLGARPGKFVGIFMERSVEMIVAVLGILKSGAACIPLDSAYPKERLAFMLEDSGAPVVISQQAQAVTLPASGTRLVCLDSEWQAISKEPENAPQAAVTPEDWMYVIYTSGSTGRPKGVVVPHRVLVNLVAWHQSSLRQSQSTFQFASLNFDVSFQEIFSTFISGGVLVVPPEPLRLDLQALGQYLQQHVVERVHLPPVVLQKLAEEFTSHPEKFSAMREFMAGGEQLQITPAMVKFFRQLKDCRLYNHYGPSETHVMTSFPLPEQAENWPALPPLGRPISNTELYVLDNYLQPVPIGVPGELYISGTCVVHGYLKRPALTAERFLPNPFSNKPGSRMYKTGDLVRYRADGNVEFLGRNDFQVKIRGMRVELGEIEVELKHHPGVHDVAVIMHKDAQESRLIAYVVFHAGQTVSSKELRDFLHERLPDHMVPAVFVPLEEFPLTPSGKIDRRALPEPGRPESTRGYVAPRTELEEVLAIIFSEVLQVERVGIFDDFFELGGHSLLATQISSRIREALHVELPVRRIFESPAIDGLARAMLENENDPGRLLRNAKLLLELALASDDDDSLIQE